MSDYQGSGRQGPGQMEAAALIEVTRNTAALQSGLAGMMAKLDAVREMLVDHKQASATQLNRMDGRIDSLTQDQRAIDAKVDKWQGEAIKRIDEAIALGERTKKAVEELNPPVARWRDMESRLKTGMLLLIGFVWIVSHFWPAIQVVLKGVGGAP